MKYLALFMILLQSTGVMANSQEPSTSKYEVKCERPGITTSNQFDLVGVVEGVSEGQFSTGVFTIISRERGVEVNEIKDVIQVNGTVKVFDAGTLVVNKDVVHLQFADKVSDIAYISILGNHPGALSSEIRLNDGTSFKSKCIVK